MIENGGGLIKAPMPRPSPRYNLFSVAALFLGVIAFLIFLAAIEYTDPMHSPEWQTGVALIILGGAGLIGFVLGYMALASSERLWGLTAFGLLLNAGPA